jgi:predicted nucleotidyltransferase
MRPPLDGVHPEARGLVDEAAGVLVEYGAREVYVFGSVLGEAWRGDSDIDLAARGLPPNRFFPALGRLLGIGGRSVDLVDLDDDDLFTTHLREKGTLLRVR